MVDLPAGAAEVTVRRDIVVVGASAGGVEAVTELARHLPGDLPAAVFVVVHIPPTGTSVLPEIMRRFGPLAALHAADGEPIHPGRIYVAPPDRHLLVHPGRVRLSSGARENRNRPAVDPLFRTAARAYRARVTAVMLSGMLDDGVAGLDRVKRAGGLVLAQDPAEAAFPSMPQAAIDAGTVDRVLRIEQLARAIDAASRQGERVETPAVAPTDAVETRPIAAIDRAEGAIGYSCPDCGGTLWPEGTDPPTVRCRVGHAFTEEALAAGQAENVERGLWAAARALAERVSLAKRMLARAEREERVSLAARYRQDVAEAQDDLGEIQRLLFRQSEEAAETASG